MAATINKTTGVITVGRNDGGNYTVKCLNKDNNTYTTADVEICVATSGALVLEYTITTPGVTNLFYEKVSPAGNENTISVFPAGTTAQLIKIGDENDVVIEAALDLYHETTSKADTCFTYNFTEAGVYELRIDNWVGNTNDPGVHDPLDLGKAVYAQMLRASKVPTLTAVKAFAFPSNVASFYSMFNGCNATGHFPSVVSDSATRPTDMFDGAHFESIGNIVMPNAWKSQATDTGQYGNARQFFLACSNLKTVGNVIFPESRSSYDMFAMCTNLESVGVLDCLAKAEWTDGMFRGCTKLSSIKIKSLPTNGTLIVDLSPCPLDAASLSYMANNVNEGAATVKFSATSKALSNYAEVKAALEAKGYTVDPA